MIRSTKKNDVKGLDEREVESEERNEGKGLNQTR